MVVVEIIEYFISQAEHLLDLFHRMLPDLGELRPNLFEHLAAKAYCEDVIVAVDNSVFTLACFYDLHHLM